MVSVLIVTWNSARLLDACFASIDRQDYRNLEVIIIDNSSTDGTSITRKMQGLPPDRTRQCAWHTAIGCSV
jgi:glycosyltransferase involved in cell wall biosynthesis